MIGGLDMHRRILNFEQDTPTSALIITGTYIESCTNYEVQNA